MKYSLGITSTYVENTLWPWNRCRWSRDHLHIRGEYIKLAVDCASPIGSPPHTWRIQARDINTVYIFGITSTYVENTKRWCDWRFGLEDHLHIRGEYISDLVIDDSITGSPPHTWRILTVLSHFLVSLRITSTYVENTASNWDSLWVDRDHLHIRGEYCYQHC